MIRVKLDNILSGLLIQKTNLIRVKWTPASVWFCTSPFEAIFLMSSWMFVISSWRVTPMLTGPCPPHLVYSLKMLGLGWNPLCSIKNFLILMSMVSRPEVGVHNRSTTPFQPKWHAYVFLVDQSGVDQWIDVLLTPGIQRDVIHIEKVTVTLFYNW